jgi:hypothetical protein
MSDVAFRRMTDVPATEVDPATLPGPDTRLARVPFGTEVGEVMAIIARDGGVILTGALTREEVAQVNADLDPHMNRTDKGNFGAGETNYIADFMGHKTKRLVHCVRYSKVYRERIVGNPKLAEYIAGLIPGTPGNHSLGASHAIEIFPGETAQDLHRDANTMLTLLNMYHAGGPEMLVNTLLALTDITEEMGATRVIPRSHLWTDYEAPASQAQTIPALLNAGDLLLYSGRMLHGGGANVTEDRSRRVISTAFAVAFFMGEEAWPFAIPVEEVRDYPKQVQTYLGFRSVSFAGEEPGFLWRVNAKPLEDFLKL